ncbi:efflux RND transporter permease subunit [Citrobacter freundii]|uniref:efflux RND transporter permease subunit n=1 Tax=Citrobacter freundii TaxID=546 RepID=UPI000C8087AC|nr:efflux RND transporter permease subunit [Citrobacter freundii]EMB4337298.1 efflux RND transporter permease subunit [Citrobacter freundii]MBJ9041944.1 efflux RND transporter permease subunit [Citrobacter freundii]NTY76556.1 efflux RND transporter permease subunit [Citrobacter freundii]NUA13004.1 efflux RND transporter permease subunit [Citrobacter freundii]PMD03432.1 AcrB/AcrD/AcrF family protein [Citrobacter freundii]
MMPQRLNLAGQLAKYFITSKLTLVFIIAVALMGIMAVLQTPREENPQIVVPAAAVVVGLPGASAEEVESLVVTPLEGILSELPGVDHIESTSKDSQGMVQVQFKVGESKELSLIKLYDRVMASRASLPADATLPFVQSIDADDIPIVTFTLASSHYDGYALNRLAERMAERLRSTENVSVVAIRGGQHREIAIELDPDRMQAYGVTLSQIQGTFAASNLTVPLQPTVRDGKVQAIKLDASYGSAADVRNQIIAVHNNRPLYVRDVATVTDGAPSEPTTFSRFSLGQGDPHFGAAHTTDLPAVTISVAKKKGANAVVVANAVIDRMTQMQTTVVPHDIQVVVTRNDGQKADDAVNLLLEHLLIALVTVGVVLFLFLGWREALIVIITVPLIMGITLMANLLGGVTINRVTLFALILALGLLVDAGIVVIENIHRHFANSDPKLDKKTLAIQATNEIGNATNLATFAVMLVFITLLLALTGMPRQYFFPVAVTVPVAMAASILVAYIVAPWAANKWLHRHPVQQSAPSQPETGNAHESTSHGSHGRLERLYLKAIDCLQLRKDARMTFGAVVLLLMVLSLMQGAWQFIRPQGVGGAVSAMGVPIGFLPKDNQNTFNVVISMPESTPVEDTNHLVQEVTAVLASEPSIINYQTWMGEAGVADFNGLFKGTAARTGSNIAEIRVNLVDKHKRKESSIDIVRALRPKIETIRTAWPGANVDLVEQPPGPPLRSTVLAELYGPDAKGLRALSDQVRKAFTQTYDIVDITDTEPVDVLEHRFIPDKDKAALSGVSIAQIAEALEIVYGGASVSRAHLPDEKSPVAVRAFVPRRFAVDPTRLDRIFVNNVAGQPVPLAELVKVVPASTDRPILHRDNEKVTFVGAELANSVPLYAVLDLQKRLDGITAPDGRPLRTGNLNFKDDVPDTVGGYQLLWGGEMRMTMDVYRDLSLSLSGALLIIYFVLVAYYRSFIVPMVVMSAVPLGIIGIFPGHWLIGMDFSATSMVGIIALAGVVIRNSLLIIDFIQDNIRQGMSLEEAVRQAGAVRLRPILLTMLAIIFGSAIMVTDPVFGGLAISLIFGTLVSTALTVFVVPLLYALYAQRYAASAATGKDHA